MSKQSEAKKLRIVLEIDDQATVEAYHGCDRELILAGLVEGSLGRKCSIVSVETVGVKYGCFVDGKEDIYPTCVMQFDRTNDCIHATEGMRPEQCHYWRVVEG